MHVRLLNAALPNGFDIKLYFAISNCGSLVTIPYYFRPYMLSGNHHWRPQPPVIYEAFEILLVETLASSK